MKHVRYVSLFLCMTTAFLLSQSNPVPSIASPITASQADPKAQARILDNYGKLPLSFEVNHGQTDAQVKFLSRTSGYSLFLTGNEAVLSLSGKKANSHNPKIAGASRSPQSSVAEFKTGGVLRMKLRNANPAAKVTGMDELAGTSNYFIGNDPAKWRSNVPTYAKVKYEGTYSGIDLVYYGNQRQLEYDFIVAPGADPRRIAFDVRGAKRIRQDANGELVFKVGEDEIRWHKPVVYQEKDGTRKEIAAHYAMTDTNRVGFELAKYDASSPLYIDPLIYSTYLGGSGHEVGAGIAVDSVGNAYVTGVTCSSDFPTSSPSQPYGGVCDAFVSKLNSAGTALIYSTFLGGNRGDNGVAIAVDGAGHAYVAGYTQSDNFPTTPGAFQTTCDGGSNCYMTGDIFVSKLNSAGSALIYSTYLGGSQADSPASIAIDSSGHAYITGTTFSDDFPTKNAWQPIYGGGGDAFVAKLNPSGTALVYSTYLGGSQEEQGFGIAVDGSRNAYVIGYTQSTDFPITSGAFQTSLGGPYDAFVTKLSPSGSLLVYSTYLGGSLSDIGTGIAVNTEGNAYVTGSTGSTDFPVTAGAFQTTCGGTSCDNGDVFVAELNHTGSALAYGTYLGGSQADYGYGITVDGSGSAYVTGYTASTDFPTTSGAFQTKCAAGKMCVNFGDAFISKLNSTGSALIYSTFLGGYQYDEGLAIVADNSNNAYVTGLTKSIAFPTTSGAFQTTCNGSKCKTAGDAFVAVIHTTATTTTTLGSSPNPSTKGQPVTFTAAVNSAAGPPPDGETVSFMKGTTVLGTGTLSGGSASFMISTLPAGGNLITAAYSGDLNFVSSKSSPLKQVVKTATQ